MPNLERHAQPVLAELERATRKFPTWPTDPLHALAVLGEEFGELTKAMLQLTYEPHKTSRQEVRTEAIQTAAMALRLVMSLDAYEYQPGRQHSQAGLPAQPVGPAPASGNAPALAYGLRDDLCAVCGGDIPWGHVAFYGEDGNGPARHAGCASLPIPG